jgi:hypothetical protein
MTYMLNSSDLSIANYDATLTGWANQAVQSGVTLGADGLYYCQSAADRQSLIDTYGWTIIDAGGDSVVTIEFNSAAYSADENAGTMEISYTVTSDFVSTTSKDFVFTITGGTATSGDDYSFAVPVTITVDPGDYTTPVVQSQVITLNDDATPEPDETIDLIVTAANGEKDVEFGAQTTAVATILNDDNTLPTGLPVINGTAVEGQVLTADTSGILDADDLGTVSHQWLRDGNVIVGATDGTYTLGDADVGSLISVQVTYTDGLGFNEGPLTSMRTAAVTAINDAPVAVNDRPALNFDGIDDYIRVADDPSLHMSSAFTVEAWINPDASSANEYMILNKEGEYEVAIKNGTIQWAITNTDPGWDWHDTGYSVATHEWSHVALTYDSGTGNAITYINGVMVDTYTGSGTVGDTYLTMNELRIGGRTNNPDGKYFDGQIADVRVWNTARTQMEISTNQDAMLTGSETGLVGYWLLNDGSSTIVKDSSREGNDGLLGGGVTTQEPTWSDFTVEEDGTLTVSASGILINDFDADGDSLIVTLVSDVTNGTLVLNTDGSFSYTPAADWSGTDSFTYKTNDGAVDSNVATVTITVNPVVDHIVTVDTADDVSDGTTTSIDALLADKGADGMISLREAIAAANNTANGGTPDEIRFNIADSGTHTIQPNSALPEITDAVVIDGYSQPGASANTLAVGTDATLLIVLDGINAGDTTHGLTITAGGTTIWGLVINNFSYAGIEIDNGDNNTIQGNYIGLNADGTLAVPNGRGTQWDGICIGASSSSSNNVIGGPDPGDRNVISGNSGGGIWMVSSAGGNTFQGNYIGLNAAGTEAIGNGQYGIRLSGAGDAVLGNVISGNGQSDYHGIYAPSSVSGTTIRGNLIGLNAAGTAALSNGGDGIALEGATNVTIGGTTADARNVISGNTDSGSYADGIYISGGSGHIIQGNYIGTNIIGTIAFGNYHSGIALSSTSNNMIGGTADGAGNLIAYNTGQGIIVSSGSTGNAILGNAIYGNSSLGIDLDNNGVNVNNGTKIVFQANYGMNFPLFTTASLTDNTLSVAGFVGSAANQTTFASARVEIFKSDDDDTGYGEGRTYLGFLTTDVYGNFSGTLNVNGKGLSAGDKLTATATSGTNNTSEFGLNIVVNNSAPVLSGANNLTSINEDLASNAGTLVSTLIANKITDGDSGALSGIAVTAVVNTNGTWQYSTNGGSTWSNFGTLSATESRLLANNASTYVRFKPNTDWNGTVADGITFQAWDQTTGTAGSTANTNPAGGNTAFSATSASASITVNSVNDAPAGTNKTVTTPEDTTYTFVADDFGFTDPKDSPANTLTAMKISTLPGAGTLTVNSVTVTTGQTIAVTDITEGRLQFTPAANANGTGYASFTFQVQDNGGTTNGGVDLDQSRNVMTINVNAVNDPTTVTGGDTGGGNEDTTITGTLTATDDDGLADGTVFTLTGPAAHGTATINAATGVWSYTPTAEYSGGDSFTVTITDDAGNTSTQVIGLTVNAVADIAADTASTNEDTAIVISAASLLANDSFEGTPTITAVGSAVGGAVSLAGTDITFTPTPNFNGQASFTYTVTSPAGITETATATITITPINDAPTTTSSTLTAIAEDSGARLITQAELLANASDVDSSDLTATSLALTSGSGTLRDNGNGTWTYTPALNDDSDVSFSYAVSDGSLTAAGAATLDITPVDEAPNGSGPEWDESATGTEGAPPTEAPADEASAEQSPTEEGQKQPADGYVAPRDGSAAEKALVLLHDLQAADNQNIIFLNDENDTDAESEQREDDRSYLYFDNDLYKEITTGESFSFHQPSLKELSDLKEITDTNAIWFAHENGEPLVNNKEYDLLREEIDETFKSEQEEEAVRTKIVTASMTTFTVATVSYLLRAGSLVASMVSTLPIWRNFDPIIIFSGTKKEKQPTDEPPNNANQQSETFFDGDVQ